MPWWPCFVSILVGFLAYYMSQAQSRVKLHATSNEEKTGQQAQMGSEDVMFWNAIFSERLCINSDNEHYVTSTQSSLPRDPATLSCGSDNRHNEVLMSSSGRQFSQYFVMADIHGDLEQAILALSMMGVTDQSGHWTAGPAVLVQLGDLVDRGNNSLGVLELFHTLAVEARAVGGKLVTLLGNHEYMLMQGDFRYVNRDEIIRLGRRHQEAQGGAVDDSGRQQDEQRAAFAAGLKLWHQLMSSTGRYGSLIRSRPVAHLLYTEDLLGKPVVEHDLQEGAKHDCSMLLVHAGVTQGLIDAVDLLHNIASATSEKLRATEEQDSLSNKVELHAPLYVAAWNTAVSRGLSNCSMRACPSPHAQGASLAAAVLGGEGLIWSRDLSQPTKGQDWACREVREVLSRINKGSGSSRKVSRIVLGHTVQGRGHVSVRCGGRLILADVGMSGWIKGGGPAGLSCTLESGLQVLTESGAESARLKAEDK